MRLQRFRARPQPCDLGAVPQDPVLRRQREGLVLRRLQRRETARHLLPQRAAGGAQHEALFLRLGRRRVGLELEALHAADRMTFHQHLALARHRREQLLLPVVQAADQMRGAAVDEAGDQAFMQRVGDIVLRLARFRLVGCGIRQPVDAGRDVGPDADIREPRHQRIQVALDVVEAGDGARDPFIRQAAFLRQMTEDPADQPRVAVIRDLAEIGDLAGLPQQPHPRPPLGEAADLLLPRQGVQGDVVDGVVALREACHRRRRAERGEQPIDGGEVEVGIPPGELRQWLELVGLDLVPHLIRQGRTVCCGPKCAVAHAAPRAAGDLGGFLRAQVAQRVAVELSQRGEGDVVHIHVETHPDRIRCDQEIHLAVLVECDLGVARAGAEPPHHHRAAAPAAADRFGDRVDLRRAEGHDRGAWRQARELGLARMGQLRQARPRLDLRLRDQALQQRADRLGAEEHGLDQPARMQQTVGEDVAAIRIGAELDLVHRDEFRPPVERHRFHRAGEPLRLGRDDLFLSGDEGDMALPLHRDHAVVILARQQAQREADDARGMREHPRDGEVRLAGIRRAENGANPGGEHLAVGHRNWRCGPSGVGKTRGTARQPWQPPGAPGRVSYQIPLILTGARMDAAAYAAKPSARTRAPASQGGSITIREI